MASGLLKWNPFKFTRPARTEQRGAASGAAGAEHPAAELPGPERLLQAVDPFGLLSNVFANPLSTAGGTGRWFGDFSALLFQPQIDVVDEGDALRVTAELPGVDKKDLELLFDDGFLVLRGEKRNQEDAREQGCYRIERAFGRFQRVVPLPEDVDVDRAEARFSDAVLTVRLPKKAGASTAQPRQLAIQ
jgi:HSP20 family protein